MEEADRELTNNVKGISIDSLLDRYGDKTKVLIKMDIEGNEKVLYEHIEETGWLNRCDCLEVEIHEDKESKLYKDIYSEMSNVDFLIRPVVKIRCL